MVAALVIIFLLPAAVGFGCLVIALIRSVRSLS